MTNEEKHALIEHCKEEIENLKWRMDRTIATQGNVAYLISCLKRQEIALAALTAQPVKLPDVQVDNPIDGFFYRCDEVIAAIRMAGYEVQE